MLRLRNFISRRSQFSGLVRDLILLAKEIEGQDWHHLGFMNMKVQRNAFGRQRESFEINLEVKGVADDLRAVFIRAPLILEVKEGVTTLSTHQGQIVAARQEHILAASFHPELTDDERMHAYFIEMVRVYQSEKAPI